MTTDMRVNAHSCAIWFFRSALRARSHRLRLERSVARLEVALCALRGLDIKQPLPLVTVRGMNERGERALQEQPRMQTGGLDALHGDGLVQAQQGSGTSAIRFARARVTVMRSS